MDSMSYAFEGRGFIVSDSGLELPADTFTRSGILLNERNLKLFSHVDESVVGPNHESNEGAEFMEFSLGDMLQKSPVCDPCLGVSSAEIDNDFSEMVLSPSVTISYPIPGNMEVEAWLPHDAISCHNWKTSSFNSRSEGLTYYGDIRSGQSLKAWSDLSSVETPLLAKRALTTNFESVIPVLQVYDHNKGVVDYKKVKSGQHSKENLDLLSVEASEPSVTMKRAKITNFSSQPPICQVHGCFRDLSSSKDYHKRHRVCVEHSKNVKVIVDGIEQRFCQQCSRFHLLSEFDDEKRSCRKSLAGHNERRRKPQYDTREGPRFSDISSQTLSFLLPELLPGNSFCQERYELENSSRSIKLDEKHISFSKSVVPQSKGHLPYKDLRNLHGMQKQDPSKNHLRETVQELSTGENSSCGHSLLSAHSEKLGNVSTSLPEGNHPASLKMYRDFAKPSGISTLKSLTLNELCSGVIKMEGSCHVLDGKMGVYYEAEIDKNFQSAESGTTIDLQQLSNHLQRVEQQRNSAQVKQENNLYCCFTSG